jgi:arsenate reductase
MLPFRVLFLCTGNSARSQMAEGLMRSLGWGVVEVASAGTQPKALHPLAVQCMAEIGVDISGQKSKEVDPFLSERFDFVITLCDAAAQSCPVFPGARESLHWSLPDPAACRGTDEERAQVFRSVRRRLEARIRRLLSEMLENLFQALEKNAPV